MEKIFRVKLENNNWIYYNQFGIVFSDIITEERTCKYIPEFSILSETEGQFTGITDKNNIRIFENDILSDNDIMYIVEWNQQNTCWCINPIKSIKEIKSKNDDLFILLTICNSNLGNGYYSRKDMEIIGNIQDNLDITL